jgi:hypothetical protein
MIKFIEVQVLEEEETKMELINVANIGRIFPNPQNKNKSIIELSYHSVNDAPVYLEVEMAYETIRQQLIS